MKPIYCLLLILFLAAIASCDKEDMSGVEVATYYYDETQCADAWDVDSGHTTDDTAVLVRAYLKDRGITVYEVGFDDDSPLNAFCEACNCGTGRRISITASQENAAILEALNFYR